MIRTSAASQDNWIQTESLAVQAANLKYSDQADSLIHSKYLQSFTCTVHWLKYHKLTLQSNKHLCPHLVPSVGHSFSSALALILFHSFLPLSSCWMYLCKAEIGTKDTQGLFLWGTDCWSLAHLSPLIRSTSSASSICWDLTSWGSESRSLRLILCFSSRFKVLLPSAFQPTMRPISTHLCFSSSVSVSLPLSEVLVPREPEDPFQPLGPWVNAGPTYTSLCTPSHTDMDATAYRRAFLECISQSGSLNGEQQLKQSHTRT